MKIIYKVLILIVYIFLPFISILRIYKKKENIKSIKQKIGNYNIKPKKKIIWFHGSSVGEVLSVVPLIQELEKNNNIDQILITSSTLSSGKVLSNIKFKKTVHQYYPIDVTFIVEKFLNYWKPKTCIFIESEIWPNMVEKIKEKKIPLILLNARITKKSFKRWSKIRLFSENIFSKFDLCAPQNKETHSYLKKLGSKKLKNLGNLKLCDTKQKSLFKLKSSQKKFFKSKKVVLTGYSTHPTEEEFCVDIFESIRKKKNEILILIPRHVERANAIINQLKHRNLIIQKHSLGNKIQNNIDVYLIDTYGEAKKFLRYSKIIFTGGSIIPHGGQNPLDAVRENAIVLHGPNVQNFKEIYAFLSKEKISYQFRNLNQALKLVKNKKSVNINTKLKLKSISSKILNNTKLELMKYV